MELRISQIEIKLEATSKTKINYLYANIDVTDFPEEVIKIRTINLSNKKF